MSDQPSDFPLTSGIINHFHNPRHVDSTNAVVRENASGWEDWTVVATFSQAAGKGRLGRSWVTRPGESLSVSILMPQMDENFRSWLPLVVGATVVRAIQSLGITSARLKWPNDVLVNSLKLGGVLCEVLPDKRVVVGVGINLDFGGESPPAPGATALGEHMTVQVGTSDALLHSVIGSLMMWSDTTEEDTRRVSRDVVEPVLETLGSQVSVIENDGSSWKGEAVRLDDEGHLMVRASQSGDVKTVVASDIVHLR
jgi:BirA family biotin operon repressor/biotin-[acetyl-CoA-carboxylase] ligase